MPPVTLAPASGRYLSFAKSEEIAILRAVGAGVREIARQIGRSPSTVPRELRRNAATRGGGPRRASASAHASALAATRHRQLPRRRAQPPAAVLGNDGSTTYDIFRLLDRQEGKPCPLSPVYQAVRNVAAALALRPAGGVGVFGLITTPTIRTLAAAETGQAGRTCCRPCSAPLTLTCASGRYLGSSSCRD